MTEDYKEAKGREHTPGRKDGYYAGNLWILMEPPGEMINILASIDQVHFSCLKLRESGGCSHPQGVVVPGIGR